MKSTLYKACFAAMAMASAMLPAAARPADNTGTFTTVIEEDFSLFTKGSPDRPDGECVIENGAVLGNIPSSLTHMPGWRGAMVYQAGGAAWVDVYQAPMQTLSGIVITPVVPNEDRQGYWIASIRTYLPEGQTDNMEFTLSYGSGAGAGFESVPISGGWTTVEAVFPADIEADAVYFTFNTSRRPVLVDDVNVEFYRPYLPAPKALPATGYDGTSFTARWSAVDQADAYLLSVYSKSADGGREYVLEDLRVQSTDRKVNGLDTDRDYYYIVKAVNQKFTSPESAEIEVKGVTAPVMKSPTDVSDNGFSAEWEAAPMATHYDFWAYVHHTATGIEDYVLIDEKFSRVVSTGSVGNPETVPDAASETLDHYIDQPGWILYAPVHIDGAVGMDVSFYTAGIPCYLMSPLLDLSQGDGTVEVSFRVWVTDTGTSGHQTQPVVSMLLEAGGDTPETVAQVVIEDFTPGRWSNVSVTVGEGSRQARVMIFPYGNAGYMYVDNLRVVKRLNAGESILNPVFNRLLTDTGVRVEASKQPADCWAFRARSYRVDGDIHTSGWSDWMHSDAAHAGACSITAADTGVTLSVDGRMLTVYNNSAARVVVADSYGRTVGTADEGVTVLGPLAPGLYMASGCKAMVR